MKFRMTRRAECELDRIQDYYELKTGSSETITSQFDYAFEHLRQWPRSGHHRPDLLSEKYRFWRVGTFLVVYFVDDPWLVVVAIAHASRDLIKELETIR